MLLAKGGRRTIVWPLKVYSIHIVSYFTYATKALFIWGNSKQSHFRAPLNTHCSWGRQQIEEPFLPLKER